MYVCVHVGVNVIKYMGKEGGRGREVERERERGGGCVCGNRPGGPRGTSSGDWAGVFLPLNVDGTGSVILCH